MTGRGRRYAPGILFATAIAGLIGAHLLDYLIVVPQSVHRRTLLHQTGHGYLPLAVVAGAILGIGAVLATAARGSARRTGSPESLGWFVVACRLSSLQVSGFLALEVGERLVARAPLADVAGWLLGSGVLLQFAVAGIAAALLRIVHRAASFVATALRRRRGRVRSALPVLRPAALPPLPRSRLLLRRVSPRAPPLLTA